MLQPIGEPASWADGLPLRARATRSSSRRCSTRAACATSRCPAGARWYDWWTTSVAEGGTSVSADFAADRLKIPLWVREGSILPVDIENDVLGLGTDDGKGARTILAWPSATASSFEIHEADGAKVKVDLQGSATGWSLTLSALPAPVILRVRAEVAPRAITGADVTSTYDAATHTSIVRAGARAGSLTVTAQNP